MQTVGNVVTDADILAAVVSPDRGSLTPEAARSLLELRFSDEQVSRMRELAEKNNEGIISAMELAEMESYARVGNLLSLVQSKARLAMKVHS